MKAGRIYNSQSHMKAASRFRTLILCVAGIPLLCFAAKEFSMPRTQPAAAYPAHDYHSKEKVTVGLDPYDSSTKASIFVVPYRDYDLLPVLLVVTNDSDQPVELSSMKAELETADGAKLHPASEEDIYRRISHPSTGGARVPLPFPTKRVKGGVNSKELAEIENALFKARAVEPLGSQAGFLFFDVSDLKDPLKGADFYLTGVRDSSGNELMYFDVSLDKYVNATTHN